MSLSLCVDQHEIATMGKKWAISRIGDWRNTKRHGPVTVLMRCGVPVHQVVQASTGRRIEDTVEHDVCLTDQARTMSQDQIDEAISRLRIRL